MGAYVPVFALEYAGLDPKLLGKVDLHQLAGAASASENPLSILASFGGPPLWKVTLLATLPVLMNGIASYFLVPL
ncbi:MAG: hypothetical protein INR71_07310, partial [Terriglobus roseus]|nr:hypothetical protein [Terriglobus roseus]